MESKAMCLGGIFKGLEIANSEGKTWTTSNEVQGKFLEDYKEGVLADLPSLKEYLEGIATSDSAILNKWFADRDFPNMNITIPPEGMGIGTIFDLLVDWKEPGKKRSIYIRELDSWFEGVEMKPSSSMQAWQLSGYKYPMFELAARQDNWKVFLVEADQDYPNIDLPNRAMQILQLQRKSFELTKLHFPFVDMQMDVDVSFLVEMEIENGFRIDEVIKKVKLRLDDKGARAQSAVAMVCRGIESGIYTIEKPFFIIFWREGLNFPSFVAIATPEMWVKGR